jgi:PhnB protein
MNEIFSKLSNGGTVTKELSPEAWGDTFGMLVDKHGVDWFISIPQQTT